MGRSLAKAVGRRWRVGGEEERGWGDLRKERGVGSGGDGFWVDDGEVMVAVVVEECA